MNQYITWDNLTIKVGDRYRHKSLGFIVEVAELDEDPHWLCAVKLRETEAEPKPPSNFFYEQPVEYFLKNWEPI